MTSGDVAGAPVAFYLPSLAGGGAERIMMNLAAGFAERGFRVDLVLANAEGPYLAQVPMSVHVIDLKGPTVLRSLRPLAAYLRRERPSVLLAALNHANLVAMAAGRTPGSKTRIVISLHSTMARAMHGDRDLRTRAVPRLMGLLHHWADAIVAVSEGVADDAAAVSGIPRERFDVIYNPVLTPILYSKAVDEPQHPWFAVSTPPVVLGVGRLMVQKNFPALIEAFALVRRELDARLVILGEGPERATIEAAVRRLGIEDHVALPGFLDNPYACIARAAVLALSSDWEGLPTVLIESLALGTPVVSTDCPSGPREILLGGTLGRLVPTGDVTALASAIVQAITSPRPAVPPAVLQRFAPDVVLDQYQRVLGLPCGISTRQSNVS